MPRKKRAAQPKQRFRVYLAPTFYMTDRERDVAELLCRGLTDKEIAARLQVTPRTPETHIQNLMHKAGVSNRIALAIALVERELVDESRLHINGVVDSYEEQGEFCLTSGKNAIASLRDYAGNLLKMGTISTDAIMEVLAIEKRLEKSIGNLEAFLLRRKLNQPARHTQETVQPSDITPITFPSREIG